jgi:shikimate dehydrogenase
MIRATTKLFAVIGDPIEHSLSPVLQNRFIRLFGLDAVYTAFRVAAGDVQTCVQGMKAMGIGGLNVTVPHKEAVVRCAQEISEEVKALQVANTLYTRSGRIHARVTDPY